MREFLEYLQGNDKEQYSKKNIDKEKVSVIKPKSYQDIQLLIDSLKQKEGFIVDFEDTEFKLAQRMLDFLSGAIYSLEGSIDILKNKMYILLPKGLNIKTKLTKGER